MMDTHVVIMAGGIGSRLWPLSTPERPKQFIDVLGVGKSLIQLTVERFLPVCAPDKFWVVTSEKYVDIVREQLPDIPAEQVLAEPEARNTAPCIAYACWKIAQRYPAANIVVTPADALVLRTDAFADAIRKALAATDGTDAIVTVGITPTRPETGYGYIHAAEAVPGEVVKVSAFKEKPDAATAEAYLADGHYFWNAGIFVWNVKTITRQLRAYAPCRDGEVPQHLRRRRGLRLERPGKLGIHQDAYRTRRRRKRRRWRRRPPLRLQGLLRPHGRRKDRRGGRP